MLLGSSCHRLILECAFGVRWPSSALAYAALSNPTLVPKLVENQAKAAPGRRTPSTLILERHFGVRWPGSALAYAALSNPTLVPKLVENQAKAAPGRRTPNKVH